MRFQILAVALVACALAGCSNAPLRFYTLVKPATDKTAASTSAYVIEVLPVTVPSQVDQPQLVIRQGDGELALAESRQWVAPVSDEIRAALSAELSAKLGVVDVYRAAQPAGLQVYHVRADVRRFESSLSHKASIEMLWSIQPPQKDAKPHACLSRVEEPVTSGYAALVEGHQRALAKIAGQIAQVLQASAAGTASVGCPGP